MAGMGTMQGAIYLGVISFDHSYLQRQQSSH
jgi:hypothetical protein